jgi:hypothetical protein
MHRLLGHIFERLSDFSIGNLEPNLALGDQVNQTSSAMRRIWAV